MKPMKIIAPTALAALALTLSACGGPAAQPGAVSTAAPTAAASAKTAGWDINEQPRASLKQGGTARFAISDLMTNWNGAHVDGNQKGNTDLQAPLTPKHYTFNASGKPVMNKNFLTDAKDEVTDGKQKITLTLNDKAVWGDGTKLAASDWIATWKALNGTDTAFQAASTEGWDQVESVVAGANEQQVVLTFKSTYPDWTAIVADGPYRADSVKDAETFNKAWTTLKNEWLSGPYKVESISTDTVTEVPNDKWWGEKPLLDKITFKAIAPDATASAFANKEIDHLDIGPDPDAYARASATPETSIRKAAGPNFRHITFNSKAPSLSDVKVRQAIVMGLDRTVIARSDLAGVAWDPTPLNNNVFLPSQPEFVDLGKETGIDYNVEGAKALLDEAGWTLGADGVREKDGQKLVVRFMALSGVKAAENEALQAQNMLKQIGIDLQIVSTPIADFVSGTLLSGANFDLVAFSWIGTPYPMRGIDQIYGSGASNFAQLRSPELDALTAQIATEIDPAKRADLAKQAAKVIWTEVHTLPLYQRPELVATTAKLANYGAFGLGSVDWVSVGFQN